MAGDKAIIGYAIALAVTIAAEAVAKHFDSGIYLILAFVSGGLTWRFVAARWGRR